MQIKILKETLLNALLPSSQKNSQKKFVHRGRDCLLQQSSTQYFTIYCPWKEKNSKNNPKFKEPSSFVLTNQC